MTYKMITAIILLISCSLYGQNNDGLISVERELDSIFMSSELPGLGLIVVNNEAVLLQKSFGMSDVSQQREFKSKTIQNIGSVSKTFLGLALMKAVSQGALQLDDDINMYLPFRVVHPRYPNKPITIRNLANHSSGINDDACYDKSYVLTEGSNLDLSTYPKQIQKYIGSIQANKDIRVAAFLENVLSNKGMWYTKKSFTKHAPGKEYNYSNIGAALAAFVLEKAVGLSYEAYTEKYIFAPLNMLDTGWNAKTVAMHNHAVRYFPGLLLVPDYHLITSADGALITNTTDFGRYLIEVLRGYNGKGTLLSPESYTEMFKRTVFKKGSSGVFWGMSSKGNPNHSGADPGVFTIAKLYPKQNVAIFMMTNISAEMDKDLIKSLRAVWSVVKKHDWSL